MQSNLEMSGIFGKNISIFVWWKLSSSGFPAVSLNNFLITIVWMFVADICWLCLVLIVVERKNSLHIYRIFLSPAVSGDWLSSIELLLPREEVKRAKKITSQCPSKFLNLFSQHAKQDNHFYQFDTISNQVSHAPTIYRNNYVLNPCGRVGRDMDPEARNDCRKCLVLFFQISHTFR